MPAQSKLQTRGAGGAKAGAGTSPKKAGGAGGNSAIVEHASEVDVAAMVASNLKNEKWQPFFLASYAERKIDKKVSCVSLCFFDPAPSDQTKRC